jgi:hypothetical protein
MARSKGLRDTKDACSVLEYLIHDLIVGPQLYDIFVDISKRANVKPETERAVRRMYVSYVILTLSKLSEFLGHYKSLIPDTLKHRCTALESELVRRKVRKLRNTFVGHIHKKDTGRPVDEVELNAAFNAATDNDLEAFLRWVFVPGNVNAPNTVVGLLEAMHAHLRAQLPKP